MRTTNQSFRYAILIVATFVLISGMSAGSHAQEISASGPIMFFKDQPNIEPSGVLPIGNGAYLLVADDNTRDLAFLTVEKQTGKILKDKPGNSRIEPKRRLGGDGERWG